jgi:hypothetical protein
VVRLLGVVSNFMLENGMMNAHALVEICDFVTNEFATSCDYLTFTTTVCI